MKKIILAIFIILILTVSVYQLFFKKPKSEFSLFEVVRGVISQEISETGKIKKGEEINLSFKSSGEIEKIYVKVGDNVEAGQVLAKLKTTQLNIQLEEAKAALEATQANLNKLMAGARKEEVEVVQAEYRNAQINLSIAQKKLADSYQNSLNVLDSAHLSISNALNSANSLYRKSALGSDGDSIRITAKIGEEKAKIEIARIQTKNNIEKAKTNSKNEDIDEALSETRKNLNATANALNIIREVFEESPYRGFATVEVTDLDTQRAAINAALNNIINSQQTISLMKLNLESAQNQLQLAKDKLGLTTAKPRQEDIDLYQAQLKQAQAKVNLLENQIAEAELLSPIAGQITKIKKSRGELVQSMLQDFIITVLPKSPFEIEVNIYEEDVVKIEVGNPVEISLAALPAQVFKGKVVFIDPAEKIIDGVIYYGVIIDFEGEISEGIKPGMTADVVIKTISKENVLMISGEAIQKKDDKTTVEVFKNGEIEEREIETGLWGSNDLVEVISGLTEGEKIIIK